MGLFGFGKRKEDMPGFSQDLQVPPLGQTHPSLEVPQTPEPTMPVQEPTGTPAVIPEQVQPSEPTAGQFEPQTPAEQPEPLQAPERPVETQPSAEAPAAQPEPIFDVPDFSDEDVAATTQEEPIMYEAEEPTQELEEPTPELEEPIQEQEPTPEQEPMEQSEEITPIENKIIITQGEHPEVFVEKEAYKEALLSLANIESDVRKADSHLTRVIDDEAIITAKMAEWNGVMNEIQEKLMLVDNKLFEGEKHG